jgi:hypothetical protein
MQVTEYLQIIDVYLTLNEIIDVLEKLASEFAKFSLVTMEKYKVIIASNNQNNQNSMSA